MMAASSKTKSEVFIRNAKKNVRAHLRVLLIILSVFVSAALLTLSFYTSNFVQVEKTPILILACFAIFLLIVSISIIVLQYFSKKVYSNLRSIILFLIFLVSLPLIVFLADFGFSVEGMLLALLIIPSGVMGITGLLGASTAFILAIFVSLIIGFPNSHDGAIAIVLMLCASFVGIIVIDKFWPVRKIALSILMLSLTYFIIALAIFARFDTSMLPNVYYLFTFMPVLAALSTMIIAVGITYFLARPFHITTKTRLMELSNSSTGLLYRMSTEAPGSYHSSVMVATIAEAGAITVNADPLLTRVGALYHDIGKLKRPSFFVENQVPLGLENKHPKMSPRISHLVLTSHVKEGVEIAEENNLPEEIIDVIRSHHGTTLAAYFYHRALSESDGTEVKESDFRYPGPKPQTKEAAIVMLADSVQAAVKSLKDPNRAKIDEMVDNIFNNRLYDGQFDECSITLRELTALKDNFGKVLTGLYTYTRIEYPEVKKEG